MPWILLALFGVGAALWWKKEHPDAPQPQPQPNPQPTPTPNPAPGPNPNPFPIPIPPLPFPPQPPGPPPPQPTPNACVGLDGNLQPVQCVEIWAAIGSNSKSLLTAVYARYPAASYPIASATLGRAIAGATLP